jgi:hypothetical protein
MLLMQSTSIVLNAQEVVQQKYSNLLNAKKQIEFVENKGQVIDQNGALFNDVLYYASLPDGLVYVTKKGVSFEFHTMKFKGTLPDPKQSSTKKEDFHWTKDVYRIDMQFNNANTSPTVIGEDKSSDYVNFYLAHCADGITGVHKYERVYIRDVYDRIDFVLYKNEKGIMQYDFIIHPGGNPKDISFTFHGADSIGLTNEQELKVFTPFGVLLQGKPYTYQEREIPSSFIIDNTTIAFNIGDYDTTKVLTIDPPTRIWGTYYGDTGSDKFTSVATDPSNNVYVSGFTTSSSWIASSGAHQTTYNGTLDAMLVKFTSGSGRLWGTYYGGASSDASYGVVASSSSVYITGFSESTSAISTTGAHQTYLSGSSDGMIVKFSSSGIRQWGTYYGGIDYDAIDDITLDGSENLYLVGQTNSNTGIATSGAHQSTIGGSSDGIIVKLNMNGVRQWGTYYGGFLADYARDVVIDASGNPYICGSTSSSTSIATSGSHQSTLTGGEDGFVVKFSSSGSRQWGTYYGGSADDYATNIARDGSSNIYIVGETSSTSGIATSGAHQTSFGAGTDAFIVKFNINGVRQWGSFYAGDGDEGSWGVVCDASGNVYFGGTTTSTNNIASSGAYQTNLAGSNDEMLVKFNSSGVRQWGTYYGGTGYDISVNLAIDGSGYIYNAGATLSTTGIAYNGFYNFHSGSDDGYVVKWDGSGGGGGGSNSITCNTTKTVFCPGEVFTLSYTASGAFYSGNVFQAQLSDQFGSFVNPTIIGSLTSVVSGTITCTIPISMTSGSAYRVRVVSSSPAFTGTNNGVNIVIYPVPSPVIYGTTSVCLGTNNVQYSVTPVSGHSYQWFQPSRGTIVSGTYSSTVVINWNLGSGTEALKVRQTNNSTGCYKDTIINVNITPAPTPVISGSTLVCLGATNVQYSIIPTSGHSYQWYQPSKGSIVSGTYSSTVTINWNLGSGTDQLKVRQTNNATGCFKDTTINVTINSIPNPYITGKAIVCEGDRFVIYQVQTASNHSYQWQALTKGSYVYGSSGASVTINWNSNASGYEQLKVRQTNNLTGCYKDTTLSVYISPKPSPVINGEKIVCTGSLLDYSVQNQSAHSYQWQYPKYGTISSSIYSNTVKVNWTKNGIDTLKVRQIDNASGCYKDTSFVVVIQDAPNPSITGNKTLCFNGSMETYNVQYVQGYSYTWYGIEKGTVVSGSTGSSLRVIWDKGIGFDSIFVLVTDKQTGCAKVSGFLVEVTESPKVEIFGPSNACENQQNLVFKTTKRPGSTYTWTALTQNLSIKGNYSADSVIINAKSTGVGFIKLTEMNIQGCIGDTTIAILIENGIKPEITTFGGGTFLCKGDSRGLECKSAADTYVWKRDGVIIPGAIDRIYLAFIPGRYSVNTKSGDCIGESDAITLVEVALPTPVISGPKKVTANQKSIAYQVNNKPNSLYKWEIFGNAAITSDPNNTLIVVDFYDAGNAYIKVTETDVNTCIKDTIYSVTIEGAASTKEDISNADIITIYPNPLSFGNELMVHFPNTFGIVKQVKLFNSIGNAQNMMSSVEQKGLEYIMNIDASSLPNGLYSIIIETEKGMYSKQCIIAK